MQYIFFLYISYDIYVALVSLVASLGPCNIDFLFVLCLGVYFIFFCAVGALGVFSYFLLSKGN